MQLKQIVSTIQGVAKDTALMLIIKLEHFMKYDFLSYRSSCKDTSHSIHYALANRECSTLCSKCQLPFQVIHFIKIFISGQLHYIVDNCGEKMKFFMAYLIQVQNQHEIIKSIYENLDDNDCLILWE